MALRFAKDTLDFVVLSQMQDRDKPVKLDYSQYVGKFALVTLSNDHERTVPGQIARVEYREFFEQPFIELKLREPGPGTLVIPRSNLLHIHMLESESDMSKTMSELMTTNWVENRSPLHFTYLGNVHVICELTSPISEVALLGGNIIHKMLLRAAEELRQNPRSPIRFNQFVFEIGNW